MMPAPSLLMIKGERGEERGWKERERRGGEEEREGGRGRRGRRMEINNAGIITDDASVINFAFYI